MITSHVWRPTWANGPNHLNIPAADRPCWYMNCRQPRAEHNRPVALSQSVKP